MRRSGTATISRTVMAILRTHTALRLVQTGRIDSVDGGELAVHPATICVHGDAPNAVEVARAVRTALEEAGVTVAPLRSGTSAAG